MPRLRARHPASAGFTFIELMVVIAILGLMSALVVGNLDGLTSRSQLRATSRAFGNLLLSVKDQAVLQSRDLTIEVDLREQRWRVVDAPSPTDVPDPDDREEQTFYGSWQTPGDGIELVSIEFSRSDRETRGTLLLTFGPDGQLSPSGFVAYFKREDEDARNEDEAGVSVEVTGLTGLVDYKQGRVRSEEVRDPEEF